VGLLSWSWSIDSNRVVTKRRKKLIGPDGFGQGAYRSERNPVSTRGRLSDNDRGATCFTGRINDVSIDANAILSEEYGGMASIGKQAGTDLVDGDTSNEFKGQGR